MRGTVLHSPDAPKLACVLCALVDYPSLEAHPPFTLRAYAIRLPFLRWHRARQAWSVCEVPSLQ